MRPIPKSKLVWVTIPAGTPPGQIIPFPDVPDLRDKMLLGVEAYNRDLLAATPDGVGVVQTVDLPFVAVTWKDYSFERIQDTPCTTLVPTNIGGLWKQFVPFVPNWQASFIRVTGVPAVLPCTVPFNVFYTDRNE